MRMLSKVMTNRLRDYLPGLISDKKNAFMEGRLLTDNALIAFEINYYIKRRRPGRHGVDGLKIIMSKANDRLEWGFIEKMLYKFGFNQLWISRIMIYMRTLYVVSYKMIRSLLRFNQDEGLGNGILYPCTYIISVRKDLV